MGALEPALESAVRKIFGERTMITLSLVTIPGAVLQLAGVLNSVDAGIIDAIDIGVVTVFIAEYVTKFYLSSSKTVYASEGWNILNLAIIVVAFGGFLTSTPLLYSAPLLRAFRATKLVGESGRSSEEITRGR